MKKKDILIKNVDVGLLRKQRDEMLVLSDIIKNKSVKKAIDGVINLLDHALDVADGFEH